MVQALFTRNVCVCICVRFQEWVLLQQMMVFIHKICIWPQRSRKNANAKVKCEQGFIHTGCLRDWGRDMDEWVAWFYVEHFTLHLNRDRGWQLLSPIVLVPVLSRFLFRHRTQPVWLHQNRRDTILISILVGDALFYLPGKETLSAFHIWLIHFFPRYSRENTNVSQQIDQQFGRYSVPEYLRHRPAYFVKHCVQQIQNAGYPNIGMISEIEKRVFKVS